MITAKCSRCGEELNEPGGLLFGPPTWFGLVGKDHLCRGCYRKVLEFVYRRNEHDAD